MGKQKGEMSGKVSEDQVKGLRVELRAQRNRKSKMVELRTEEPGSMHSPGSKGERGQWYWRNQLGWES